MLMASSTRPFQFLYSIDEITAISNDGGWAVIFCNERDSYVLVNLFNQQYEILSPTVNWIRFSRDSRFLVVLCRESTKIDILSMYFLGFGLPLCPYKELYRGKISFCYSGYAENEWHIVSINEQHTQITKIKNERIGSTAQIVFDKIIPSPELGKTWLCKFYLLAPFDLILQFDKALYGINLATQQMNELGLTADQCLDLGKENSIAAYTKERLSIDFLVINGSSETRKISTVCDIPKEANVNYLSFTQELMCYQTDKDKLLFIKLGHNFKEQGRRVQSVNHPILVAKASETGEWVAMVMRKNQLELFQNKKAT